MNNRASSAKTVNRILRRFFISQNLVASKRVRTRCIATVQTSIIQDASLYYKPFFLKVARPINQVKGTLPVIVKWLSRGLFFSCRIMASKNEVKLENLNFENLALDSLPIDPIKSNHRRQVPGACFSLTDPTPVDNPQLVVLSEPALSLIDLDAQEALREHFVDYFSGNKLLPGSKVAAHCYCGHQFGYFSGQLGDGAAMYLGEIVNSKGERWELQLKGAGQTPYSRQADGRKVLRSSIREFLCSEAMHNLGVPTTRAGTCITSDTKVVRDVFYCGDPILERATIITRIAPTFLRFGSFEIFKPRDKITGRSGPSEGKIDILHDMLNYSIRTFFPTIFEKHSENQEQCYLEFYKEVVRRTARLVAEWQTVGFCHGVLNTDNMSILGITIDYGPFGFMDYFDPDYICNASDDQGRYSYQNQPNICKWNCYKFAEALQGALPLTKSVEALEAIYDEEYKHAYLGKMRAKLGLKKIIHEEDEDLIDALMDTMKVTAADFTNTFRGLKRVEIPELMDEISEETNDVESISYLLNQCQSAEEMKKVRTSRTNVQHVQMLMKLMQVNPALLDQIGGSVRMLQQELEKLEQAKEIEKLTQEVKSENDRKHWNTWVAKYRSRLSKEVEDLSPDVASKVREERNCLMNSMNPRFVLRNYIAQQAIEAAENGDFSEIHRLLQILEKPYLNESVYFEPDSNLDVSNKNTKVPKPCGSSVKDSWQNAFKVYERKAPSWAADLRVT